MDMNASYNKLVEKHPAHAAILYDRYYMQAQFGKDVLGAVRLEEAKRHKAEAEELRANISHGVDKRKRLPGLISHATHPISTGKLEGFNNKIKVPKGIGYGYRNDEYFFTLIRYSSIPSNRIAKENTLALNV